MDLGHHLGMFQDSDSSEAFQTNIHVGTEERKIALLRAGIGMDSSRIPHPQSTMQCHA